MAISNSIAVDIFKKHDLHVGQLIIDELRTAKDGPLASAFKPQQYYKAHFKVVEPFEYALDARSNKTFPCVPLLKSLRRLFSRKDVVDKVIDSRTAGSVTQQQYLSFRDGEYYKNNVLLSGEDSRISLHLNIDDFEVCNPFGTSRKKHKLCAVFWILGNLVVAQPYP